MISFESDCDEYNVLVKITTINQIVIYSYDKAYWFILHLKND